MFVEKQNHGIKVALLSNGYKYQIYSLWEPEIQIGDSLSKKKGDFKLIIYSGNNLKTTLDYRDTYKKK